MRQQPGGSSLAAATWQQQPGGNNLATTTWHRQQQPGGSNLAAATWRSSFGRCLAGGGLAAGVLAPVQDQFWAKWMAGCAELPEQLSNKLGRPKW